MKAAKLLFHFTVTLMNVALYLPLIIRVSLSRQKLQRRPESSSVTDGEENVSHYDKVMVSRLAVFYAVAIEVLFRASTAAGRAQFLDIAPGPGHFTMLIQRYLRPHSIRGIDLSAPMIAVANSNARKHGVDDSVTFGTGDATHLESIASGSMNLVTMTFAAHHLPTHEHLCRAVAEMDRVATPDGVIAMIDLIRLPTASATESFVRLAGRDYKKKGMQAFYRDFHESMYAAWTTADLAGAVPEHTERRWMLFTNGGLPTMQILLGFPADRPHPFVRRDQPWKRAPDFLPVELLPEWALARTLFFPAGKARLCNDLKTTCRTQGKQVQHS